MVRLLQVALIAEQASALVSSRFTKVQGSDGLTKKFFDLSPDAVSIIGLDEGVFYVPSKLSIDPIKMSVDLTDRSF